MTNWTPRPDRHDGPIYLGIADQIAAAVERGELAPGTRLPTHRDLAGRLKVSTHTVSQAYAEAERRGLVVGEIGRGTFVRAGASEREARFIMDRRAGDVIDLSINRPAHAEMHATCIRAALGRMSEAADLAAMLVCRPISGLDPHRQAGAVWLRRRGLEVPAERILLCNGAAHAMTMALATLTRPGDVVACEALVDHGLIGLAGLLHVHLKGLPIDAEGLLPDALEEACASEPIRVLCLMPTLGNPTVALMGEARRRELVRIARRFDLTIVENDVYGMLVPDAPPPLAALAPERGHYVTSFTKILVSGLRTGYLVAPAQTIARLRRSLRVTSWMATPLVAELASRWIADGTAGELLAWQRRELAARHAIADQVLAEFAFASHPHSLHVWLTLPEPWRAEVFVSEARLEKVAVAPADPFALPGPPVPQAIRISLGAARDAAQLRRGLEIIAELLGRDAEPFYMPV